MRELVFSVLDELGIIIPNEILKNNQDFDLREYIQDSLTFISAILRIEEKLQCEIPEEYLNYEVMRSFNGFCEGLNFIK